MLTKCFRAFQGTQTAGRAGSQAHTMYILPGPPQPKHNIRLYDGVCIRITISYTTWPLYDYGCISNMYYHDDIHIYEGCYQTYVRQVAYTPSTIC